MRADAETEEQRKKEREARVAVVVDRTTRAERQRATLTLSPSLRREGAAFRALCFHQRRHASHSYPSCATYSRNALSRHPESLSVQINSPISRRSGSAAAPLAAPSPRQFSRDTPSRLDVVAMAKGKGGKRAQQMMSQAPVSYLIRERKRKRRRSKRKESTRLSA